MTGYLLDTNVVSELIRVRPYPAVIKWLRSAEETLTYLSVITLGEIWKGVQLLSEGKKRNALTKWLEQDLIGRFAGRVLPIDQTVANSWGILTARMQQAGRPLGVLDGLIAATAEQHGLTLVTRDVHDFSGLQYVC